MLKIHNLLIGLTVCGLVAVGAAGAQESLVNQAQQAASNLVHQATDLGSQTSQQAIKQLQQQQQQQQFIDPQRLLELGINPVGSAVKYFLPNTYQAVSSDLGNGYMMLTNGANKGYNSLSSQFSSMGDSLVNGFQSAEQNLLRRYAQINQQQEDIVRRMQEIMSNPEQLCRQIREQGQSAYDKVSQQAGSMGQQATRRPSSGWFGK